jgi:hypothetical protein
VTYFTRESRFILKTRDNTAANYEVIVGLPNGLFVTPLPSSLPMMAVALGLASAVGG